jgi:hypothetical protein
LEFQNGNNETSETNEMRKSWKLTHREAPFADGFPALNFVRFDDFGVILFRTGICR